MSYKLWEVQMIVTSSVAPPVQMPDRPAHTQACAQDCLKLMGARTLGARNGMHMPGARSVLRAKNASVPTPNEIMYSALRTTFRIEDEKR